MESKLKYADKFPEIWETLGSLERTGWIRRNIKDPETVKDHSLSCMGLVCELREKLVEFSDNEIEKIINMLEVHDYAEYIVGDIVTFSKTKEESAQIKADKNIKEIAAINEILKMGSYGKEVYDLWMSFENREDDLSSFANQVDKFQAVEKAYEYELMGEDVDTMEFVNYARDMIKHPVLVARMREIEEKAKTAN